MTTSAEAEVLQPGAPTATGPSGKPVIHKVTIDDLSDALRAGVADFKAFPSCGLFTATLYALGGAILIYAMFNIGHNVLAFPVAAGFALVAPFAAVGLYEVSRRRENGQKVNWTAHLVAYRAATRRSIVMLGFVLFFVLFVWVEVALLLYALFYGNDPVEYLELFATLTTSMRGIGFLLVGNAIGALFAFVVFAISAVSFPMLLDREVDFITAILTSIEAVKVNWQTMLGWAIFIAFMLVLGIVPFFLGLLWVLPVLGHATWHLYRKLITFE